MGAMPKTGKNDHARKDELPSTLQRSDQEAQDTFAKTYDSALESYDNDESRAARTSFASLKHSYGRWATTGSRRRNAGLPISTRKKGWVPRRPRREGWTRMLPRNTATSGPRS